MLLLQIARKGYSHAIQTKFRAELSIPHGVNVKLDQFDEDEGVRNGRFVNLLVVNCGGWFHSLEV